MRIDCHAHLLPPERMAKLIRWTRRRCNPAHPVPETVTLEALLDEYRAAGVASVWNFAHAIFPEETYGGTLPLAGFDAILRAFPELPVVFAHANYPWVGEAFELLARHPSLHLDTVHVFARVTAGWSARKDQPSAWAELRAGLAAFPDRVMFGTDHPSGTGTLGEMYADVDAFGLPADLARRLLGETSRRLVERVRPLPASR